MADITLTLYNNTSAPNVVRKRITQLHSLTGDLKESAELESVSITIPYVNDFANINYAYIPQFNRYYYVQVTVLNGELIKLDLTSDVLMSFWNSFRNSKCIAKRSSSNFNLMLPDDRLAFSPQPTYIRRKTASKFTPTSSGSYVLTVGGKG